MPAAGTASTSTYKEGTPDRIAQKDQLEAGTSRAYFTPQHSIHTTSGKAHTHWTALVRPKLHFRLTSMTFMVGLLRMAPAARAVAPALGPELTPIKADGVTNASAPKNINATRATAIFMGLNLPMTVVQGMRVLDTSSTYVRRSSVSMRAIFRALSVTISSLSACTSSRNLVPRGFHAHVVLCVSGEIYKYTAYNMGNQRTLANQRPTYFH